MTRLCTCGHAIEDHDGHNHVACNKCVCMYFEAARQVTFDSACYDLAEHFLPDTASVGFKKRLAAHIQEAVEDWMECYIEANPPDSELPTANDVLGILK